MKQKVNIPTGEPVGRVTCGECGNTTDFVEVADDVQVTTNYIQNVDGSFTLGKNATEVFGEVHFICGACGRDLSHFHAHFLEMSF